MTNSSNRNDPPRSVSARFHMCRSASRDAPSEASRGAASPPETRFSARSCASPRTSASNSNPYRCNRTPDTGFQRAPPMRTPSLSQRGAETRGDAIAATAPSRSTRGPLIPNAPPVLSRRFGQCGVTDPEGTTRAEGNNDNCWVGVARSTWQFRKGHPPFCPVGARRAFLRFRTSVSAPRLSRRPPWRHNLERRRAVVVLTRSRPSSRSRSRSRSRDRPHLSTSSIARVPIG